MLLVSVEIWGPSTSKHELISIPVWIGHHIPSKVWDQMTRSFPNFNSCSCTVDVWEWLSNSISYFTMDVITYPCWDSCQSMLVKGAPAVSTIAMCADMPVHCGYVRISCKVHLKHCIYVKSITILWEKHKIQGWIWKIFNVGIFTDIYIECLNIDTGVHFLTWHSK